jgi:hypothetical protein
MDPNVMEKTGQRLMASDVALEYGFDDLDATPEP